MFIVSLLQLLWGQKWRTERRRTIRFGLPFFLCLLALTTAFIVWQEDKRSSKLQNSLEGLTKQTASAENANKTDRKLLQDKIDRLQESLNPFLKIAEVRHPNFSSEAALAQLAKEIDTLTKKTEKIDSATQQMEERAKPRILTPDQKKAILTFLANQPKGAFVIKANISVPDAWSYSDQIAEPFRKSGWNVRLDNAIISGPNVTGVWITIKNPDAVPPCSIVLKSALEAAGIVTRAHYDPGIPDAAEVWLLVGSK
jgi:hypothetical protein